MHTRVGESKRGQTDIRNDGSKGSSKNVLLTGGKPCNQRLFMEINRQMRLSGIVFGPVKSGVLKIQPEPTKRRGRNMPGLGRFRGGKTRAEAGKCRGYIIGNKEAKAGPFKIWAESDR